MVGVDGEGLFGAGGATTGRSMLAAQCAPPPMKEHSLENIMAAVLAIAGAIGVLWGLSWTIGWESNYERRSGPILLIFGIVFGLISIPIFRSIFDCEDWNNTKYPKRLEVWKRKWICKQCGHIYVPTAQSAGGRK